MSGVRRLVYALIGSKADMPSYYEYTERVRDGYRVLRRSRRITADEVFNALIDGLTRGDKA